MIKQKKTIIYRYYRGKLKGRIKLILVIISVNKLPPFIFQNPRMYKNNFRVETVRDGRIGLRSLN